MTAQNIGLLGRNVINLKIQQFQLWKMTNDTEHNKMAFVNAGVSSSQFKNVP